MLIVSPFVRRAAFAVPVGVVWLDQTSSEQYLWFSFVGAVAGTPVLRPASSTVADLEWKRGREDLRPVDDQRAEHVWAMRSHG
jgi:hypothetical protein